jgi:hypothetical protein
MMDGMLPLDDTELQEFIDRCFNGNMIVFLRRYEQAMRIKYDKAFIKD